MQKLGESGTKPKRVSDPLGGTKSVGGQVLEFKEMKLADGTKVFSGVDSFFQINDKMWNSGVMEMGKLKVENLRAEPKSPQLARRVPGKAVSAVFIDNRPTMHTRWRFAWSCAMRRTARTNPWTWTRKSTSPSSPWRCWCWKERTRWENNGRG